jgi:hypothetical protein
MPDPIVDPQAPATGSLPSAGAAPPVAATLQPLDFKRFQPDEKIVNKKIIELVYFTEEYAVVICEEDWIYYEFGDGYEFTNDAGENVRSRVIDLIVKAETVRLRPMDQLRASVRKSHIRTVAYLFVAILEKRFELAEGMLVELSQMRSLRMREVAQLSYLAGSLLTFLPCIFFVWLATGFGDVDPASTARAMLAGGMGALFFSMIRRGSIPLDGEAGKVTQYADGFVRVMVGLISGVVALSAIESELIFGFLEPAGAKSMANVGMTFLVCFVSGYSEVMIPSLIGKIEEQSNKPDPVVTAPAPAPKAVTATPPATRDDDTDNGGTHLVA